MKALIHSDYGRPDEVLSVEDVDKPVPQDDEVLVRVRAASMHPDVWHVIVGVPFALRLMGNGVRKPKWRIPGTDIAGVIESVGKSVTRFLIGRTFTLREVVAAMKWMQDDKTIGRAIITP